MTIAPYTPATVGRIRGLARTLAAPAIAAELGWTPHHLGAVAKKHGIDLPPLIVPAPKPQAEPSAADPPPPPPDARVTFDPRQSVLRRDGYRMALPPKQGRIFTALWRARGGDCGLTGTELGDGNVNGIPGAVQKLNRKLAPFGLVIVNAGRGQHGGYRLQDLTAEQTSPSSADPDSSAIRSPEIHTGNARNPRNSQGGT